MLRRLVPAEQKVKVVKIRWGAVSVAIGVMVAASFITSCSGGQSEVSESVASVPTPRQATTPPVRTGTPPPGIISTPKGPEPLGSVDLKPGQPVDDADVTLLCGADAARADPVSRGGEVPGLPRAPSSLVVCSGDGSGTGRVVVARSEVAEWAKFVTSLNEAACRKAGQAPDNSPQPALGPLVFVGENGRTTAVLLRVDARSVAKVTTRLVPAARAGGETRLLCGPERLDQILRLTGR
jgi:hypothetical protein